MNSSIDKQISKATNPGMLKAMQSVKKLLETLTNKESSFIDKMKEIKAASDAVKPFLKSNNKEHKQIAEKIIGIIKGLAVGGNDSNLKDLAQLSRSPSSALDADVPTDPKPATTDLRNRVVGTVFNSAVKQVTGAPTADSISSVVLAAMASNNVETKKKAAKRMMNMLGVNEEKAVSVLTENMPKNFLNLMFLLLDNNDLVNSLVKILNDNSNKEQKWTAEKLRKLFNHFKPREKEG